MNTVTGSFGDPVNLADPTSVLLAGVTPTDLWAAGQTVGQAPLGLQPNGTTMFFHFGHQSTARGFIPYISASFDLAGPVDPGPSAVPEPGTWLLLTSGLGAIVALRRKKAQR